MFDTNTHKFKAAVVSIAFPAVLVLMGSGGIQIAYRTIQSNGTPQTQRTVLNFVDTASVTWSCTDVAPATQCQATASGGATGYTTIDSNGSSITQRATVNFISGTGATVTCVDNAGATRSDCTISATGSGGGFIQTLTAPVSGNFTALNYNTGTGVVTTQVNNSSPVTSMTLLQHDPNNTGNIAAFAKNIISATFTLTEAFALGPSGSGNQSLGGMWLSDGGSPPVNLFFCYQSNVGLRIPVFSNFTTFSGDVISSVSTHVPSSPLVWLRIQETASNRIYFISTDGITFAQIFSEAVGAHFTTAQYGVGLENRGSSATIPDVMTTMYSFKETNP